VPLKPEKSRNYTLGAVWSPAARTSLTLDYYHIVIDRRLALQNNAIGAAQIAQLIAAGIPAATANLLNGSNANFFVNAFDSEINGVDLAAGSTFDVNGGDLRVDLRHNFNRQRVSNVRPGTINLSRVYDLEHQVPHNNTVLSFDYSRGDFLSGVVRFNRYGEWSTTAGLFSPGDASDQYGYGSKILVDLEARMTFGHHYNVTIGGENIFNTYPDPEQDPTAKFLGVKYALTSPFGVNGAFWYARLGVSF